MKRYLLLAGLSVFSLAGYAQSWQSIGLDNGYLIDEIVVADDSSVMILGNQVSPTLAHAVWQSLDNGVSWQLAVTNIRQGIFQRALLINSGGDYLLGVRDALNNDTYIARVDQKITTYTNQLYEDNTDGIFSLDRYMNTIYASGEECAVGNISCAYPSARGTVYKSTDDGDTWQRLTNFPGPGGHDIQVLDQSIVFVKGRIEPALYFSLDGGVTWDSSMTPQSIVGFHMMTDNIGFIGTLSGKIFSTVDRGDTWTYVHSVGGNAVSKIERAGNYLVAASQGTVAISTDGGLTWTNESFGQNRTVYDVAIGPAGTYLACDEGRVFYKQEDLSQHFLGSEPQNFEKQSLSIYPNPVDDVAILQIPDPSDLQSLKMMENTGRAVDIWYETDGKQVKIYTRNVSAGIYLIGVTTSMGAYAERIVIK